MVETLAAYLVVAIAAIWTAWRLVLPGWIRRRVRQIRHRLRAGLHLRRLEPLLN